MIAAPSSLSPPLSFASSISSIHPESNLEEIKTHRERLSETKPGPCKQRHHVFAEEDIDARVMTGMPCPEGMGAHFTLVSQ